ncbi:MAG: hypothetical protein M3043_18235 [Lysinibacillus fusiformis]|nr:hypothetical protein [Lysinibacillus fusiformis]
MKKFTGFFYAIGFLASVTFIYNFVKSNFFDWSSLYVAIALLCCAFALQAKQNPVKESHVRKNIKSSQEI